MKLYLITLIIFLKQFSYSQELEYVFHEPHLINSDEYENITAIGNDMSGNVFMAGDNSKIYKYDGKSWSSITFPGGGTVEEITANKNGDIFVAVKEKGLLVLDSTGWNLYDYNNSNFPENPQHGGIEWDEKNSILWIGTNQGLVRFENGNINLYNHSNVPEMVDDEIKDLVIGPEGDIWMVSNFSTLIHYNKNQFIINPIGWNYGLYDLLFNEIDMLSNGLLTIASQNYGLIESNGESLEILSDETTGFSHLAVDQNDINWLANQSDVFTYTNDSFNIIRNGYFPEVIKKIFINRDNNIWIIGDNSPVIEILNNITSNVNKIDKKNNLVIYPNPVKSGLDVFIKMSNEYKLDRLIIYDIKGKMVFSGISTEKVNINLVPGTYFMVLKYNKKISFKKLVVKS